MSVSITQVENFAIEILNASQPGSPYGTIVSRRFKDGEAKDSILLGDASTIRSILNSRGHGRRKDFLTGSAAGLAHGAQLATRIGPLETIVFVITSGEYAGTVLPIEWADTESHRQELLQENRNATAEDLMEPHYILSGGTIFHNAAGLILGGASVVSVNATWCNFTLTAACQSPDEFVRAVALASLAIEMMKDGQRVGAGNMFENMFRAEMRERGVPSVESPTSVQQEAA